ncbi:MAG: chloramphenicol acetyltransferase, partial [Candidatus Marinimicrobia bacterium]|jgi:chloramphenicol O-acetyltransferase type A|nr:chloramphenicol acetyltransferase [Candidatus Neomarinimicrobiota bacterium]
MRESGRVKQYIDIDKWERAAEFRHFISYSHPYFGVCVNLDCSKAYARAKGEGISFFLYYFYRSLAAANEIPQFRTRIEAGKPVVYDEVHGSPTILRDDGGLGYALLLWNADFETFRIQAEKEIAGVKAQTALSTSKDRPDTIYYSILPWLCFTAVSHPLNLPRTEGVPILTFGKCFEEKDRRLMPVAVHAHHALMDGLHISRFLERLEESLNKS